MDDREARYAGHPPACTCAMCGRRRSAGVSYGMRVSGCPVCGGSKNFRFHHGQYWDVFVGYNGRTVEPEVRARIGEGNRFRCRGCDGIVARHEIDDSSLTPDVHEHDSLPKAKDEIHEHWERQRETSRLGQGRRTERQTKYLALFVLTAVVIAAIVIYLATR